MPLTYFSATPGVCRAWLDEPRSPLQGEDVTVQYTTDTAVITAFAAASVNAAGISTDLSPEYAIAIEQATTLKYRAVPLCSATDAGSVFYDPADAGKLMTAGAGSSTLADMGKSMPADAGIPTLADAGKSARVDAGKLPPTDAAPDAPADLDAALVAPTLPLEEVLDEGWYFADDDNGLWLELCPNLCASLQAAQGALLLSVDWGARTPGAR